MNSPADLLARTIANGLVEWHGAEARLEIPLREIVVNDLLLPLVVARQPGLQQLTVMILENNGLVVQVRTSAIPLSPLLTLRFTINRTLALTPSPTIGLKLRREGLTRWLSAAQPLFTRLLSEGVTWSREGLAIDLGSMLRQRGLDWLVPLITSGELQSEPGILWAAVRLAVE